MSDPFFGRVAGREPRLDVPPLRSLRAIFSRALEAWRAKSLLAYLSCWTSPSPGAGRERQRDRETETGRERDREGGTRVACAVSTLPCDVPVLMRAIFDYDAHSHHRRTAAGCRISTWKKRTRHRAFLSSIERSRLRRWPHLMLRVLSLPSPNCVHGFVSFTQKIARCDACDFRGHEGANYKKWCA